MENRFDELAKALAGELSRREALRRLGGGMAVTLLAVLGTGRAEAQGGLLTCLQRCKGVGGDPRNPASWKRYLVCLASCSDCRWGRGQVCGTTTTGSVVCCQGTDACCGSGCCPAGQTCCNGSCCNAGQSCQAGQCALPLDTCLPGSTGTCDGGTCSGPNAVCVCPADYPGCCQGFGEFANCHTCCSTGCAHFEDGFPFCAD